MRVTDYQDLDVYRRAFAMQQEIFVLTQSFPTSERYALADQVRRSSRSTGANLAEAWKKRSYPAPFRSKLTDADAETAETRHWIATAYACGYLTDVQRTHLDGVSRQIGRMLGSMIRDADRWCSPKA